MPKEYRGIERSKIPWYPKIDYDKCINCGTCVEYCKLGTYIFVEEQGEKKPLAQNPNNCVVLCTGCKAQCPVGAISFPSKQKTRKLIKKLEKHET